MHIKETPGPGQYTPDDAKVKAKAAKYSMGTQKKKLIPCQPLNENPGAGAYDPKKNIGGPAFGFGSEARDKNYVKPSPGPGDYKIPTKIRDTAKFGLPKN